MTAQQPHPLRCETCQHSRIREDYYEDGKLVTIFCLKINREISMLSLEQPHEFLLVGCASHTSAPAQQTDLDTINHVMGLAQCLGTKDAIDDEACLICPLDKKCSQLYHTQQPTTPAQQQPSEHKCHVCRTLQWDNRLIWSLEELLAWVREHHMDQQDIRNHIDLELGKYRQELRERQKTPDAQQRIEQAIKELRPHVLLFALSMEWKLRRHDKDRGDRGWVGYTSEEELNFLLRRLQDEVDELSKQVRNNPECVRFSETWDVGNFAMMIDTVHYSDKDIEPKIQEAIALLRDEVKQG